ncbi:MAG: hypothetical protein U0168_16185 [Nannocystaceae bacterium]
MPTVGDFVSHNASQPVARMLQEWLVGEVENLAASLAACRPRR